MVCDNITISFCFYEIIATSLLVQYNSQLDEMDGHCKKEFVAVLNDLSLKKKSSVAE